MKTTWTLGIAAISILMAGGLTQIACSSSSSDNGGSGDAGAASDGSVKHDSGSTGGGDSGGGTDGGTVGNGPCATECAQTACANPPKDPTTGDACDTCINNSLNKGAACNTPVINACKADPDCIKLLTCVNGTPDGGGCPADGGTAGDAPDGSTDTQCQTFNANSCINCCVAGHQMGNNTFNNAILTCACGQ